MVYKDFILDVLKDASEIATSSFGKVKGYAKPGDQNQVLTETDLKVGDLIINKIKSIYPNHNIIDEEKGAIDNESEFTWVIDPIDGTSNFASSVQLYCISLGLLYKDFPIAGGVAAPEFSEYYFAEKGEGAYLNNEKIKVTDVQDLKSVLISYQIDAHAKDPDKTRKECALLAEMVLEVRNFRSSGTIYDSMFTAAGKFGGCLNRSSKIWDNVAQHIIIEEAGGIYTDFFGKQIDYSKALERTLENFTYCAASPILYKKLQEIIQRNI